MKISITGTGRTGTAIAFALTMQGLADHLVLVSRDPGGKAEGDALDLAHASVALNPKPVDIRAGRLADAAGSDVVVVTNSVSMQGMSDRNDLAAGNSEIFREMLPRLADDSPDAVFVIVTNPVDVMTHLAVRWAKLSPRRVIGTGTLIDTVRFRSLLAEMVGIHSHDVRAYVLGEHGESMVPALSQATAGGVRLPESDAAIKERFERARRAGLEILRHKGYTDYAVAACTAMIVQAVADNTREVLPVSTTIDGPYGLHDLAMSLPCVIGRRGVLRVLQPTLSDDETAALMASAAKIKGVIDRVTGR